MPDNQPNNMKKTTTLKGIKKEVKTWIKKNPDKTLKNYLEKFCKQKNKIKKYESIS